MKILNENKKATLFLDNAGFYVVSYFISTASGAAQKEKFFNSESEARALYNEKSGELGLASNGYELYQAAI